MKSKTRNHNGNCRFSYYIVIMWARIKTIYDVYMSKIDSLWQQIYHKIRIGIFYNIACRFGGRGASYYIIKYNRDPAAHPKGWYFERSGPFPVPQIYPGLCPMGWTPDPPLAVLIDLGCATDYQLSSVTEKLKNHTSRHRKRAVLCNLWIRRPVFGKTASAATRHSSSCVCETIRPLYHILCLQR